MQGQWVAAYIHGDGVSVVGPFATERAAYTSVIDHYRREFGDTDEGANARYAESPNEWVTRVTPE